MANLDIIYRLLNQSPQAGQAIAADLGKIDESAKKGTVSTSVLKEGIAGFGAAIAPATVAIGLFAAGMAFSIDQASEAQEVNAALTQTITNLGDETDLTVDSVNAVASSLAAVTTAGDDTIAMGVNIMAQFGGLTDDTLPAASQAMLDLAVKTGSVESAANLLGPALARPEDAVGKLRRAGVLLTEQEQEQIEAFTAAGNAAAAKQVILDRVAATMGGQATAAANTLTGSITQLKNQFGEAGEAVGMAVVPQLTELSKEVLPPLIDNVERLADVSANQLAPAFSDLIDTGRDLGGVLSGVGFESSVFWEGIGNEIAQVNEKLLQAQFYIELIGRPTGARWELAEQFGDVAQEAENASERVEGYRQVLDRLDLQQAETTTKTEETAEKTQLLGNAYDYLIPRTEAVTTSTRAASGAYDYMIQVAERNENRMESYGETLEGVDEGQEEVADSARDWAGVLDSIVAGAMERTGGHISGIADLYGDLEEATGEWVTTTVNNNGRIATANEQLMGDLDDSTREGYQAILTTAAEGSAEWLAAYQALQGDLTQSQRNALVAQIADLQAHSGETIAVYTGDAEAVEEIQGQINEAWATIAEGHRQMVVDILVQQAQMEGGFNQSVANVMVATGLMTADEARLQLSLQETTRQVGLVGDALIETFLEDGSVSRAEAALLEEAIGLVEAGALTAGEVLTGLAQGGLADVIVQADNATIAADRFYQKMLETEGDYQVTLTTTYNTVGVPPDLPGGYGGPGSTGGGQGAGQGGGGSGGMGGAMGLDFIVPAGFPRDSFGPIWVQSGEHVKVTPAGQTAGAGGNTIINIDIAVDARWSTDPTATEIASYRGTQRALAEVGRTADIRTRTR